MIRSWALALALLLPVTLVGQPARVKALLSSGGVHQSAGRLDEADRDFAAARAEAERLQDATLIGDASTELGYLHYSRGEMNDALVDLRRGYDSYVKAHDERGRRLALSYIAHVYADSSIAQYDRAIEYYRQVLPQDAAAAPTESVADTLYNIGSTYEQKGDENAALDWYRKALAVEEKIGRLDGAADVKRSIAVTLRKLGRPAEALPLIDEAIRYLVEIKSDDRVMAARQSRGIILRKMGRLDAAIADLEASRAWFRKAKNDRYLEKSEDELAQAYAGAGRWQDAYRMGVEHSETQKQLASKLRDEETSRLRVQFDAEKKEQENRTLLVENAASSRVRRLQTYVLVLSASALLLLAYLAFRLRTTNRELHGAQEKIERLSDSAGEALRDVRAWSQGTAADLAVSIHAKEIVVFTLAADALKPLSATHIRPPRVEDLETMSHRLGAAAPMPAVDGNVVVAAPGLSGRFFGALTIVGKTTPWSESERQLISTFAHQLGGALELQQVRNDLVEARARNQAARREMTERGIQLVQVCPQCLRCFDDAQTHCPVDAFPLDTSRILPFRIAGRYRLVNVLGSGGMGEVIAARDERLDRDVAVKVIKEVQLDSEMRSRFDQEARVVAKIHHPNVVSIYDSGELPDGSAFIVTELLDGCDLQVVMDSWGPGTPSQVASLLRQGAAALSAAHAAGIIHRDVKPGNLFLVNTGQGFDIKLVDFGIAKSLDANSNLTLTGTVIGTPAYMAPEQITSGKADARSDLYCFAAVAYEALTGVRVSGTDEGYAALWNVMSVKADAASLHRSSLTPAIDAAFEAALSKKPEDRPADLREWADRLGSELESITDTLTGWPRIVVRRDGGTVRFESVADERTEISPSVA
jgi:tetratricopeptide (TPR) repeat protein